MICPKCNKGELQECEFDGCIGECDNLNCGALFNESGQELPDVFTIYERADKKVYIYNKGIKLRNRKLPIYHIWCDENKASSIFGVISFNAKWRQFTTKFAKNTEWSAGCKRLICDFEDVLNEQWRESIEAFPARRMKLNR